MSKNTKKKKVISKKETAARGGNRGRKAGRNSSAAKATRGARGRRSRAIEEVQGTVSLARDGFGFVMVEGRDEDIFVPQSKLRGALHGDTVKAAVTKKKQEGKRTEGEVIHIIERSKKPYVGVLSVRGHQAWVIIENARMPYDVRVQFDEERGLPEINGLKAVNGLKVAVLVTEWPRKSLTPVGRIVDVLGKPGDNDTEMHAILAEYGLPYTFPEQVENAADHISERITAEDLKGREDFRRVTTFTIDPADAKDFDDAISFRALENGNYEAGVHIADVTHYVSTGDVVDKEAYERGTSVYLVDRTIPMLPEKLCNKLCSLRPHEDKLCFSAIFEITEKGKVVSERFCRTVINSDYRLDYAEAQEIITTGKGPLAKEIGILHEIATVLRKQRFAKGAINFERPEMKVEVDENGKPVDVYQKISMESNWLIEEFMLLANRSVAEFVTRKMAVKKPTFVYRVHENPNPEKLQNLRTFAKNFGHEMGPTDDTRQISKSLNALFKASKGRAEENAIELMALRCMARARYTTDNLGHYGLAFKYYTHFTSPIRRYPDMMVHRLLAQYLDGAKSQDRAYYEECCMHSSAREQLATEAERSSIKYKMVEFMQDKIGMVFEGTISGLTERGMYVEIEPTMIEGMVSVRNITQDYLVFDEEKYIMTAKASRKTFTLGDKVKVRAVRANLEQKLLDYELIWED